VKHENYGITILYSIMQIVLINRSCNKIYLGKWRVVKVHKIYDVSMNSVGFLDILQMYVNMRLKYDKVIRLHIHPRAELNFRYTIKYCFSNLKHRTDTDRWPQKVPTAGPPFSGRPPHSVPNVHLHPLHSPSSAQISPPHEP
jgi:hypothetical protein